MISLVDRHQEANHARCKAASFRLSAPLITTLPCLTEAMYFLGDIAGWSGQEALWRFFDRDVLQIHFADRREIARARTLMEKYADTPMDLADASLVAAAETFRLAVIFTLDATSTFTGSMSSQHFRWFPEAGWRGSRATIAVMPRTWLALILLAIALSHPPSGIREPFGPSGRRIVGMQGGLRSADPARVRT
jgi:uncharacterized protein